MTAFPYQIKINFGKNNFFNMIKLLNNIPIKDDFFKLVFYGDYRRMGKLLDNVDFPKQIIRDNYRIILVFLLRENSGKFHIYLWFSNSG